MLSVTLHSVPKVHGLCHCFIAQVRLVDLNKEAVRPYSLHTERVKCISALNSSIFMSGSADGTIRLFDVREPLIRDTQEAKKRSLLGECIERGAPHFAKIMRHCFALGIEALRAGHRLNLHVNKEEVFTLWCLFQQAE
jgi:WD40 repeat protein